MTSHNHTISTNVSQKIHAHMYNKMTSSPHMSTEHELFKEVCGVVMAGKKKQLKKKKKRMNATVKQV